MRNYSYLSYQEDSIYKYKVLTCQDLGNKLDKTFLKKIVKYCKRGWIIDDFRYFNQKGYPNKIHAVMKKNLSSEGIFSK